MPDEIHIHIKNAESRRTDPVATSIDTKERAALPYWR